MGAHLGRGAGKTFALAGGSPLAACHGNRWASGAPWNLPYMFKGATSFPFLLGGVWQAVSASWWHLLQDWVWQGIKGIFQACKNSLTFIRSPLCLAIFTCHFYVTAMAEVLLIASIL